MVLGKILMVKLKVECVYDWEKYEYILLNENNGVF